MPCRHRVSPSLALNRIVVACGGSDYHAEEARIRRASLEMFPRHLLGAVPILYAGNLSSDQSPWVLGAI